MMEWCMAYGEILLGWQEDKRDRDRREEMNTGGGDQVHVTFFGRGDMRVGERDSWSAVGVQDLLSAMIYPNGMFMHNNDGVEMVLLWGWSMERSLSQLNDLMKL